jgi:hypothetical protein
VVVIQATTLEPSRQTVCCKALARFWHKADIAGLKFRSAAGCWRAFDVRWIGSAASASIQI